MALDREDRIRDICYPHVVMAEGPALARATAAWLAAAIRLAIRERGSCTVGLAGGSTPAPIYRELATPALAQEIDWTRVDVYFSDERAAPPDHPDNNYRMVRERLLAHVPIPATRVHRMAAERERRVVSVHSPKPPPRRLTITPPVIAAARSVTVVAVGEEKAAMAARALAGPFAPGHVPAQLARHGTWFLDPQAAALLAPGPVV